jgi:hypothetical protein
MREDRKYGSSERMWLTKGIEGRKVGNFGWEKGKENKERGGEHTICVM